MRRGRRRRSRRAAPCVGVVDRDRLVGAVSARQDERRAEIGAEEMVERRVGEHQPEPGRPRRDGRRERRIRVAAQEHDRPGRQVQQRPLLCGDRGQRVGLGGQHRERLLFAVLARAQPGDRVLVARVAGEVIAAEPLDGDDAPVAQQPPTASSSGTTAAARRRDSRSALRGSGGRPGPRTRAGSRRRAEPGHRRVRAGRRALCGRS